MARKSTILSPRIHIVLVPGFAGFDALGQLEYYAGTTHLFQSWQNAERRPDAVLHYFDNFPTAAVKTRAARLQQYLITRMARGEFQRNDSIALVGHSTGGLDIRSLVYDLAVARDTYPVDGGEGVASTVAGTELLAMINRVVFISVPQCGTNIADWVKARRIGRELVVMELRASVACSQVPMLDRLLDFASSTASEISDLDLLYAIEDALREADVGQSRSGLRAALAQEACSELELWLRHMATDFAAIDDLTAEPSDRREASPAHFPLDIRRREKRYWKHHKIETRSYATIGPCPFWLDRNTGLPRWDFSKLWTCPECTIREKAGAETDITYRTCYRACASGPFEYPNDPSFIPLATPLDSLEPRKIELWENDGIVNTASMLWPNGSETNLVEGDHMDVVGHYARVKAVACGGQNRQYAAYDLLKSGSNFNAEKFQQLWEGIFDFCIS